jgi:hypothetical protein
LLEKVGVYQTTTQVLKTLYGGRKQTRIIGDTVYAKNPFLELLPKESWSGCYLPATWWTWLKEKIL